MGSRPSALSPGLMFWRGRRGRGAARCLLGLCSGEVRGQGQTPHVVDHLLWHPMRQRSELKTVSGQETFDTSCPIVPHEDKASSYDATRTCNQAMQEETECIAMKAPTYPPTHSPTLATHPPTCPPHPPTHPPTLATNPPTHPPTHPDQSPRGQASLRSVLHVRLGPTTSPNTFQP